MAPAKSDRGSEIVHAHAHDVTLTKAEKLVFAEAMRRAEKTREDIEGSMVDFGRWLLIAVFDDDAGAALDEGARRQNPVWRTLLARAGGPTLKLNDRFLYTALRIAAHDKRIQDDAWRLLDPGRKEILLPLRDDAQIREAAHHAVDFKLTQRQVRAYVRETLAESTGGKSRMTPERAMSKVSRIAASLGNEAAVARMGTQLRKLDRSGQREAVTQLKALRVSLARLLRALEGG